MTTLWLTYCTSTGLTAALLPLLWGMAIFVNRSRSRWGELCVWWETFQGLKREDQGHCTLGFGVEKVVCSQTHLSVVLISSCLKHKYSHFSSFPLFLLPPSATVHSFHCGLSKIWRNRLPIGLKYVTPWLHRKAGLIYCTNQNPRKVGFYKETHQRKCWG